MKTTDKPIAKPASMGTQKEIDGYDVQPNQKNAIAKSGAPKTASSRRNSGGTG